MRYIYVIAAGGSLMRQRTEYLNLRIRPEVKEGLRALAAQDCRSIAGMIEKMVRERCRNVGIPIPEREVIPKKKAGAVSGDKKKAKREKSRGSGAPPKTQE